MRKKLVLLFSIFIVIIIGSYGITVAANQDKDVTATEDGIEIVTSFYPMYVLTANIVKDVEGVSVVNLTENQTGCLHDYQLTTQDMRKLSDADYFVMNGGGMESYVEDVVASYPDLTIITASEGIQMLEETSDHDHDHDEESDAEEDHDHGDYNAHVWMDMDDYLIQIENVTNALIELDPANKVQYEKNGKEYADKVQALKAEYEEELGEYEAQDIIIFHDAFAYLAQELGLNVVYTIEMESDTSLSAGEIKTIIDEVNEHDIKIMFTEEQYSDSIAASIANETDAKVYVIDSLVTGEDSLDAYLDGMRKNLVTLKEALSTQQ